MIYVKVFNRASGQSPETYRLESLPATIGRAIDNTIVIGDNSISGHHARIERSESGALRIVDLGSTNGLTEDGKKRASVSLDQRKSVQIGKVWVEIADSDEPIEETVRIDMSELEREGGWSHPKGFLVCGSLVLLSLLIRYLDYRFLRVDFTTHALLTKTLGFAVAAAGFTAVVSIFSKVHRRRYLFYELLATVLAFSIIGDLHFTLFNLISFNLNHQIVSRVLDEAISGTVIFAGLSVLGRFLFPEAPSRKRATLILAGILLVTGGTYGLRAINERDLSPDVDTTIALPLRSFPKETYNLDRVLRKVDEMETKIVKARDKLLEKESERESENAAP